MIDTFGIITKEVMIINIHFPEFDNSADAVYINPSFRGQRIVINTQMGSRINNTPLEDDDKKSGAWMSQSLCNGYVYPRIRNILRL